MLLLVLLEGLEPSWLANQARILHWMIEAFLNITRKVWTFNDLLSTKLLYFNYDNVLVVVENFEISIFRLSTECLTF